MEIRDGDLATRIREIWQEYVAKSEKNHARGVEKTTNPARGCRKKNVCNRKRSRGVFHVKHYGPGVYFPIGNSRAIVFREDKSPYKPNLCKNLIPSAFRARSSRNTKVGASTFLGTNVLCCFWALLLKISTFNGF